MSDIGKKEHEPHSSVPANPLLAEPMYLAGYIERMGTGTGDIIRLCKETGLREPEFIQEEIFKAIIWRKTDTGQVTGQVAGKVSGEATGEVSGVSILDIPREIKRIIWVITDEMKRSEIQDLLSIKHDDYFRLNYIIPAVETGFIEMTHPDNPNHPQQKYRLTGKGKKIKEKISAGEL